MTRGLSWGVPAGVASGILTIGVLDAEKIHGQFGGILATAVTGAVILVVSQVIDHSGGRRGR